MTIALACGDGETDDIIMEVVQTIVDNGSAVIPEWRYAGTIIDHYILYPGCGWKRLEDS